MALVKRFTDDGNPIIPEIKLDPSTMVFDLARQRHVMKLEGSVVLPIGAEIELVDPNTSATVVGIRLLAGSDNVPAMLCLDVEVPEEYWIQIEAEWRHDFGRELPPSAWRDLLR